MEKPGDRDDIPPAALADRVHQRELSLAKRREITGLPKSRADVALFGSLIYEQAMRQLGFAALRISTRGIRFGVLRS